MNVLKTGQPATPFELPLLSGRVEAFDPAAPVPKVLIFYKVSCPTCQFGMPYFDRLYRVFDQHGIPVRAVAQEPLEDAAKFAAEYDVHMPQYLDASPFKVSRAYGLMNVPTMLTITPDGTIDRISPAFVKSDITETAVWLAELAGVPEPSMFDPGEDIPGLKPG